MYNISIRINETEKLLNSFPEENPNKNLWKNTIFENYYELSNSQQGIVGQYIVRDVARSFGLDVKSRMESGLQRKTDCDWIIDGILTEVKCSFDMNHVHFRFEKHKQVERFVYVRVYPPSMDCSYKGTVKTLDDIKIMMLWINSSDIQELMNTSVFKEHSGGSISCNGKKAFNNLIHSNLTRPMWEWNCYKT